MREFDTLLTVLQNHEPPHQCRMSGELGAYDTVVGNMGDRNDLDLWWQGGSLVERVAAVCNNTIVVVHSVGPVYFTWSNHPNISAIIYAGAPGEQTGPAIVDVMYGAYNPSGRLPFSIADVSLSFLFLRQVLTAFVEQSESGYGTIIIYNSLGFPEVYIRFIIILARITDPRLLDRSTIPKSSYSTTDTWTTKESRRGSNLDSGSRTPLLPTRRSPFRLRLISTPFPSRSQTVGP